MDTRRSQPDIEWYLGVSRTRNVASPRCPFAAVERCPRYYHSLSLLGEAGFTKIAKADEARLDALWEKSDLLPKTDETSTSIHSSNGAVFMYCNFCPEVTYEGFSVFASFLAKYSDEIDLDSALKRLSREHVSREDWRWHWADLRPMHFTECPLYSLLTRAEPKLFVRGDDSRTAELLTLKPGVWGIHIDLKELGRRIKSRLMHFWERFRG